MWTLAVGLQSPRSYPGHGAVYRVLTRDLADPRRIRRRPCLRSERHWQESGGWDGGDWIPTRPVPSGPLS